ncbi:TetR/AcrR family transcriptional regulator [Pseudonocardia lacus]|uniref:TetR/AcrR family transcriptional regulator n=1 Tax=Pseudonocardia lacus TaxID=2835865 RepID=UPI001BDCA1A0|nr:TetR/AcrR family transcriptional regulator [Pseudonocardia lacus]
MDEPVGLRERKKARTRAAISEAAIRLFLQRGYDAVSVVEIAAEAEVSKRTLFAYFPTKEELVLHRFADHGGEPARVVHGRGPGEAPLAALRRQRIERLRARDPITGLCDIAPVVEFYRLIMGTPSLSAALVGYLRRDEESLAAALREAVPDAGPLAARLAAVQIVGVLQALADHNQTRIVDGASADDIADDALADTELAFAQLGCGMTAYA